MERRLFVRAFICGLVLGAVASAQLLPQDIEKLRNLWLQPDGLHKAALANGGTFEIDPFTTPMGACCFSDLASMTANSPLIVSARALGGKAVLIWDERMVNTVYSLQVNQVFKGRTSSALISLVMSGGSYTFPDGSIGMQANVLESPLVQETEYILFLRPSAAGSNVYELTSLGQAEFEVARDGNHLYSHAYTTKDRVRDEAKVGRVAFVQKIRNMIAKQSNSTP